MANPILQQIMQSQNPGSNIMMQAVGAMLRGESPQEFMQNLARTNPQLQGLDLNNLDKTAEELCKKNGEDYGSAKTSLKDRINQFIADK